MISVKKLNSKQRKGEVKPLNSNEAVAEAVKDADVDVVAAYPITPQTIVVETLAELIGNGELNAEMIHVESEHSALSAVIGASAVGARVFTATASQGLALMHEVLHITSGLRLPVVMSVAMRALSAPISIFNDQSDIMNQRNTGWITIIASSAQEAYDSILQAYKIAENPKVLLPVMVSYDGYVLSHTIERVETVGKSVVEEYIPKKVTWNTLNVKDPITMGTITSPEYYYEFKYAQERALEESLSVIKNADEEFERLYGRSYGIIEGYKIEDAEVALLATSSYYTNLKVATDLARKEGLKVGTIKLRVFRPFPREELYSMIKDLQVLGVIDRAIAFGQKPSGPIANDIASALQYKKDKPIIQSIIAGIGQRRMLIEDFVKLYRMLVKNMNEKKFYEESIFYGVKGIEF
ncbi:ferredoxin oxidoreductase [Fervidicoccus fontis]|uniref:2-oxoacid oxidoreductase (ferredoxin) n=1 Tax=Fervidicoccus fontis TaxID=683846 RepID=A0A2J6N3Z9_9CREN|nr:ferredoxin oxidoreductase [Fervidicoccus fontis]PMB75933.1 MAG: ferredoxin oxidoreductase [Fervidicoccus fontis]PMB77422.1 MAG: ferredoxin oxidoreductase [Fervidicoccus fontis]HEW63913.1 ferredoxin oxidoreductase [Fervidicoccus fontis]